MNSQDFRNFLRKEILREMKEITDAGASNVDADEAGSLNEGDERIPSAILSQMAALVQNTNDNESGSPERQQDMRAFMALLDVYGNEERWNLDDPGWKNMMRDASALGWTAEDDPEFEAGMAALRRQSDSDMDVRRGDAFRMKGDDKYEYKLEGDKWFTRRQGTKKFVSLAADKFRKARVKLDIESLRSEAVGGNFPKRSMEAMRADAQELEVEGELDWVEKNDEEGYLAKIGVGPGTTAAAEKQTPHPVGTVVLHKDTDVRFRKKDEERYAAVGPVTLTRQEVAGEVTEFDLDFFEINSDGRVRMRVAGDDEVDNDTLDGLRDAAINSGDIPSFQDLEDISYKSEESTSEEDDELGTSERDEDLRESFTNRWGRLAGLLQD